MWSSDDALFATILSPKVGIRRNKGIPPPPFFSSQTNTTIQHIYHHNGIKIWHRGMRFIAGDHGMPKCQLFSILFVLFSSH